MTDDDADEATKRGIPIEDVAEEWGKFCRYYGAKDNEVRTNWHKQWPVWLDKRDRYPPRGSPNGVQVNRASAAAATADAFQRIGRGE